MGIALTFNPVVTFFFRRVHRLTGWPVLFACAFLSCAPNSLKIVSVGQAWQRPSPTDPNRHTQKHSRRHWSHHRTAANPDDETWFCRNQICVAESFPSYSQNWGKPAIRTRFNVISRIISSDESHYDPWSRQGLRFWVRDRPGGVVRWSCIVPDHQSYSGFILSQPSQTVLVTGRGERLAGVGSSAGEGSISLSTL